MWNTSNGVCAPQHGRNASRNPTPRRRCTKHVFRALMAYAAFLPGVSSVPPMLTIACVLRSGGPYNADWVTGLQGNVARFAPLHRFVCLSDVDVPCERVPLITGWPGW